MQKIKEKKYIDYTEKMLKKKNKFNIISDAKYFEDNNGLRHYVDGLSVVLDHTAEEKEIAEWILKTFGGIVLMCPRVNYPDGIKTPDYIWNGEKWDLKIIYHYNVRVIDNLIKDKKNQSQNFIIDISYLNVDFDIFERQIKAIFNSDFRYWVKMIIIKNNNHFKCYKKKRGDHHPNAGNDQPR